MNIRRRLAFIITEDMIDAGLKGNELIVFAFIDYKCGKKLDGVYNGGITEICMIFDLSQPTVISIVKRLVEKGVVEKTYYVDNNNIKRVSLRTTI